MASTDATTSSAADRVMTSLPVPFSPVISTLASAGPMRSTRFSTDFHRRRFGDDLRQIAGRVRNTVSQRKVLSFETSSTSQCLREFDLSSQALRAAARCPRAFE